MLWPRGMWHLSSPTRDQIYTPCIGRQSLSHWAARKSLGVLVLPLNSCITEQWHKTKIPKESFYFQYSTVSHFFVSRCYFQFFLSYGTLIMFPGCDQVSHLRRYWSQLLCLLTPVLLVQSPQRSFSQLVLVTVSLMLKVSPELTYNPK